MKDDKDDYQPKIESLHKKLDMNKLREKVRKLVEDNIAELTDLEMEILLGDLTSSMELVVAVERIKRHGKRQTK